MSADGDPNCLHCHGEGWVIRETRCFCGCCDPNEPTECECNARHPRNWPKRRITRRREVVR